MPALLVSSSEALFLRQSTESYSCFLFHEIEVIWPYVKVSMSHWSWALQCGKYGKIWIICILLPTCNLPIWSAPFLEDIGLFVLCISDFLSKNKLHGLMLASSFWFIWPTHVFCLVFFCFVFCNYAVQLEIWDGQTSSSSSIIQG